MAWRLTVILVLIAASLPGSAARAAKDGDENQVAIANDIRVGVHADYTRVVVDLSHAVEFRVFALAEPNRIVIDLPEIDWHVAASVGGRGGGAVEAFRYGLLQPGVSRMVLDLARPAKVANAFVLPPLEGKGFRFVIDLKPVDQADFVAALTAPPPPPPSPPAARELPRESRASPPGVAPPGAPARKPDRARRKVVVIDPGHGGVDPGALGPNGIYEKNLTLAAARDFKKKLDATRRYDVFLTRNEDVFLRLRDRIAIARAKGADLFISIHADTISNRAIRGLSVYTLSEKSSDREAAELAESENKADVIAGIDLTAENPEVTNILIDLAQRETMNDSARFAAQLVSELKSVSRTLPRAHRFAGFVVLKAPDVPSVLMEMGFLSNREDERQLNDPSHRAKMGDALVHAVDRYFRDMEKADLR